MVTASFRSRSNMQPRDKARELFGDARRF